MAITQKDLDSIKVLFRRDDSLELFGVPYNMRPGQSPRDIFRAGNTRGKWIWLGSPGWWGSMTKGEQALVKAFLAKHKADVPDGPNEWSTLGGLHMSKRKTGLGSAGAMLGSFFPKTGKTYSVFTRTWWKENPKYPNGLEPDSQGRKHYLERGLKTEDEARRVAKEYNRTHAPGRLSKKAEFESDELDGLGAARDLNDNDRKQWVNNDEGLYSWWKSSRMSMREFIRANRAELTEAINKVRNRPPQRKSWRDYV
jgi:hypothetical protein